MKFSNTDSHNTKKISPMLISVVKAWRYSNTGIDQICGFLKSHNYPYGLAYYHNNETDEEILSTLDKVHTIYAFSVFSSNYQRCCSLSRKIKDENPNAIIIFGGAFPTQYYIDIFEEVNHLDYIILGDGEHPLKYLLDTLNSSDGKKEINHLSIVKKDDILNKVPYCNQNIDYLPVFDYYEREKNTYKNLRKVHCLQTKNNICTGQCSFCIERKGGIFFKDLNLILSEINYVHKNFGIKKFFFTDDNLFDPDNKSIKDRLKNLCYKIIEMDLPIIFECYSKAISLKNCKEDRELLSLMKKAGFISVFVGLESGNNQDLKLYNKRSTVEDNYTIVSLLEEYEFSVLKGFIFFNPYSSMETLRENYYFLTKIKSVNLFHYLGTFLGIHKYTAIYEQVKKDDLITSELSILNYFGYNFKNKEVEEIVLFIKEFMIDRFRKIAYELDFVLGYYKECLIINPNSIKYQKEFNSLIDVQYEIMTAFFHILFVENNLAKAQKEVDNFMIYFENIESRLSEIYSDLVYMFTYPKGKNNQL